ncbi:PAS domain-containing sensor histidine kinase [Cupriavidus sp. USMAA2-4]|uniref:PAS domain-containing sensor histidine kinase n=1 Tax=Cupriavidus sp. USMAA2-4 TaxID=876364 RepID=UPI003FA44B8B
MLRGHSSTSSDPAGRTAPKLAACVAAIAAVAAMAAAALAARRRTVRVPLPVPDGKAAAGAAALATESEARLAGIIRSSMEAIITVDEQQCVVLFNPMAETLFGWKAEDALGRQLGDFIPARYRAAHERHVRRFGVTGVTERQMGQQRTLYALRRDGVEFPIEASISQTPDGGGKLYTVMLRDTTERVLAEQALRRSREELQQLSDSILAAREEEKRRIARELHDDLGQRLSALKMDLAMLDEDLRQTAAADAARAQIAAMQAVIDETVGSVRRIAADLRPALLDELGLVPAIEWLAKDFSTRYGIRIEPHALGDEIEVPERTGTAVYRIVQEALNNVARHAHATAVEIALVRAGDWYQLTVRDNGCGWDGKMPERGRRVSFGLLGIRERARLIGGSVAIAHTPGAGFGLTVRFPAVAGCGEEEHA